MKNTTLLLGLLVVVRFITSAGMGLEIKIEQH
jgi:hypothetical protein